MNTLTQQIIHDLERLPETMQSEALDFVQFLNSKLEQNKTEQTETSHNGKIVAEILERIAKRNHTFSHIKDPVAWQREMRKDRPLPGRNNDANR